LVPSSGINICKYNDYIWLQLTREFFNLEKDIYLCFIYDPPGNSTYTHSLEENILDILEEDITKFARFNKWQV
jgi:hypothetical protein